MAFELEFVSELMVELESELDLGLIWNLLLELALQMEFVGFGPEVGGGGSDCEADGLDLMTRNLILGCGDDSW